MNSGVRPGRPHASSRETLAEAACELFLEQGYEITSIADITRRAGVSRSSFFNYFSSKSDVLWSGLDARLDAFEAALAGGVEPIAALNAIAEDFVPDALALALMNAAAMELDSELERDCALRSARVARAVAACREAAGEAVLSAQVHGAAIGGALLAAIRVWAAQGPALEPLRSVLERALAVLDGGMAPGE